MAMLLYGNGVWQGKSLIEFLADEAYGTKKEKIIIILFASYLV